MVQTKERLEVSPVSESREPAHVEIPEPAADRRSAILVGFGLFAFGLFHALPGMIATARPQSRTSLLIAVALWTGASVGFVAAAYGVWGFPGLRRVWVLLAVIASACSLVLLGFYPLAAFWPLAVLQVAALVGARFEIHALTPRRTGIGPLVRRGIASLMLAYGAAVILLHPWYQNWGATDEEIVRPMIGDPSDGNRLHLINHVVTVKASPETVWSYLIQLGQDRAGFYSYDFLERMAGTGIHNVYEIRPEWQSRKEGDFLRSCPPDWMGGRLPALTGWKIGMVEPNRLLYLETWGPMWLRPQPDGTTRLGVRTDIGAVPFLAAPLELFLFEPIHFVMEQRMLRTLKELSERK
ncbi:hypothetical protein [Fimbriimonas ginsengisoli]|uniref:Polyketide cyclase/dehydrase n=1 Tax=Fimbriimonas ginsengisoli Gsoil 348 TaxID=661478 RepID=A0A068NT71_FIMGI|nr:hypothetical protein [Fimbriimonas ginsengisoli]AIE86606.1 hypothetical protein OP10G_3238 [Fimbriimonas ginsengisoli Gsoil 348]